MDNSKVELRDTKFGKGLFAKELILAGEEIASFDGKIFNGIDPIEEENCYHAIQTSQFVLIESAGFARFANHSCEPNCGIKKLINITSMRDIMPNEEIMWDYEMTEDIWTDINSQVYFMDCKCGSSICRKKIGSYRNMPQNIRNKYKGFISEWLTTKYDITPKKFLEVIKKECE